MEHEDDGDSLFGPPRGYMNSGTLLKSGDASAAGLGVLTALPPYGRRIVRSSIFGHKADLALIL